MGALGSPGRSRTTWGASDHPGTVRTLLDNQGNCIRDRVFSAWGQIRSDTNPTVFFPFAFTGREYDPETGLYYYRARYYDPATGRFISEDPLGFSAGDTNLSRYVFNSPTHFRDPDGESVAVGLAGGVVGAGAAVVGHLIGSWLSGKEVTWEGVAAAAAGGFVGGFVAGAMAGTALTGDPSGVIAAAGIGFLSGAAGGAVESAVYQYLVNGTIDVTRLLMDMYRSAMFGAVTGGAATYLKGATPGLRDAVDDVLRPGGGLAVALPGGGVAVIPASSAAGAAMPGAISSAELAGTVVFSTGLGGALGPEDTPLPEEPTGPAPDAVDPAARQPKVRKSTKERAKAAASKTPEGDYIDPHTNKVIPKEGPFDFGHPYGEEWWRTQVQARAEGWTRKQVIEAENNKIFQIEDPSSNRGHKYEKPK